MLRRAVTRSGCPVRAGGPLTAVLVLVLSTVGLGCASAAAPSTPTAVATAAGGANAATGTASDEPPSATEISLRQAQPTAAVRPARSRPAPAARAPQAGATNLDPEPPVISATPPPTRSTRATQPVRLVVAALDIDVPVRPTGIADDGSMALPATVRQAGWYRFSAAPSAPAGSTVIAAHVDTVEEGLGPFAALAASRRGDQVVVVDRRGDRHAYRVTSHRHIVRDRLPVADLFAIDGPPRLVLITCGGAYDARNGYRDNVVVLAEPDQ